MSTPTVLPASAVAGLVPPAAPGEGARAVGWFLRPALVRAALCLVPVPLAVAAAEPLGRVPWPVPAGALAAGWCAASVLAYLGQLVAGTGGKPRAVRLVLVGFAGLAAGWSAALALAPGSLAGQDRALAYAVSLPALAVLAALAAALAAGAGATLLRWWVPALLVAGAELTGVLPVPVEPLLLAGVGVALARASAPALRRSGPLRLPRLRGSGSRLVFALSQAAVVVVVWRVGHAVVPPGGVPPALVPLLLAVPVVEVWVAWHLARVAAGLVRYDDRDRYLRYARRIGRSTLTGPLPPLAAGAALAGTATRLPYGLSAHPDAPAVVLAMAGGVLLAGVVAVGWLLSARGRRWLAAAVTGAPALAILALSVTVPTRMATSLGGWSQLLPATVIALAVAYAAGLVLVAYVLFDARSLP
jgi:hypothetical protein